MDVVRAKRDRPGIFATLKREFHSVPFWWNVLERHDSLFNCVEGFRLIARIHYNG